MVRKYSYEFKKYLVTLLSSGKVSACKLSIMYDIPKGVLCTIYNKYKKIGDESLKHIYTRNNYSREFKEKVLEYKSANNLSYEQTALQFNIPSCSVIYDWHKQYCKIQEFNMAEKKEKISNPIRSKNNRKPTATPLISEDSEEVQLLKKRITELERELYITSAENAYLKKLDALMQEKKLKAEERRRKQ